MHSDRIVRCALVLLIALAPGLSVPGAPADGDLRAAGRILAEEFGEAIVNTRVVMSMKVSYGGTDDQEQEYQRETQGTVLSADGLTVVPLSDIDPTQMMERMMGDRMRDMNINSRVKDLKLIINKRRELSATVVLRDPDLDLAFLRPIKKPAEPMKFIDLSKSVEPQLLEQVMVLGRMGRIADREVAVMTGEIQSVIRKPRTFYVPSAELASAGFGLPIFNAARNLVGFVQMRAIPISPDQGWGDENQLAVILPAQDLLETAQQAPGADEVKPEPEAAESESAGPPAAEPTEPPATE